METDTKDTVNNEPQVNDNVNGDNIVDPGDLATPPNVPEEGDDDIVDDNVDEPRGEPADKFSPKHKTWEDTESARVELEKQFTKGQQTISDLEKRLKDLEKPDEPKLEPKKETPAQRIMKEFREKASKLDPNASDHDEKIGELWMEAQAEIAKETYRAEESQRKQVDEDLARAKQAVVDNGWSFEVDIPELGGKVDIGEEAFWAVATSPLLPKGISEEEQLKWVFGMLGHLEKAIIDKYEKEREKVGDGPQGLISRGSQKRVPKKVENEPSTLQSDMETVMSEKKLKPEDFK